MLKGPGAMLAHEQVGYSLVYFWMLDAPMTCSFQFYQHEHSTANGM